MSSIAHGRSEGCSVLPSAFARPPDGTQLGLFAGGELRRSLARTAVESDEVEHVVWTEEEIVQLHWRLLLELRRLPDADTPLEEKIDALNWVFTDPAKQAAPFSFVRCVAAVTQSPLSPTPFFGAVDADAIRDWIRSNAGRWIRDALARYPAWVRQEVCAHPDRALRELDHNPQWLNEEIKTRTQVGDLFA